MKFKRTERIGAIVKILSDNPNKIYTLSYFTETFNAAKSTISEDLLVVKNVFEKLQLGKVITISALFCFFIAYLKVALEVVVLVFPQR